MKIIIILLSVVTIQDGASSCPALPNKKHRRFLRCEIWCEKLFTSQLDTAFHARFPAVLNSYYQFNKIQVFYILLKLGYDFLRKKHRKSEA